jgi:hypothetical protein
LRCGKRTSDGHPLRLHPFAALLLLKPVLCFPSFRLIVAKFFAIRTYGPGWAVEINLSARPSLGAGIFPGENLEESRVVKSRVDFRKLWSFSGSNLRQTLVPQAAAGACLPGV